MKEQISRNKVRSHYKSFFGLENMALAENDNLMIDWGESLINELINQEVEKMIAERMSDDVIDAVVLSWAPVCHIGETGEDLNANVREEIIELIQELRSRLSQKTEGGGE